MTARPRVRVGVVGAGFVAHIHGEAYRHVRGVDVELVCVTAARPERAQAYAREFGVARTVADFRAVLADPAVDLVDLCVPAHHHAPMAIEAARAGKHVIVEKPLTGFFGPPATPREEMLRSALAAADQVLAAAATARVRLCYAENWVYAPPIQKARRLLAASGGPILRMVGEESHSGTHAQANKHWVTGGGGSLIGKACHPLGGALYLKADEGRRLRGAPIRPVSVMAEVAHLADTATFRASTPRYLNTVEGADVEDWGSMLVTFDDGTVAQISAAESQAGAALVEVERSTVRSPIDAEVLQVKLRAGEFAPAAPTPAPLILLGRSLCRDISALRAKGHAKWQEVEPTLAQLPPGLSYYQPTTTELHDCPVRRPAKPKP